MFASAAIINNLLNLRLINLEAHILDRKEHLS